MTAPQAPSDDELVRGVREGDEDAFTTLYRRWQGPLYRFGLRRCGSPAVAEDVTQEVFMALRRRGVCCPGSLPRSEAEPLGTRSVEGVDAEGTRRRVVIPAGEVGNERPIEVVSERWYSKELQAVVMSRHSDPRYGETSYRLTGLTRGEPDHGLFEVPSDYTVKQGPPEPRFQRRLLEKKEP